LKFFMIMAASFFSFQLQVEAQSCPEAEKFVVREGESIDILDQAAWDAATAKCRQDRLNANIAASNASLGTPTDESNTTRAATVCVKVNAGEGKDLQVCNLSSGGGVREGYYLLDNKEFDGKVRKNADGSYTLIPTHEITKRPLRRPVYTGDTMLGSFSCGSDNINEMQCLTCSCFFEARGSSLPEQIRVARSKHTRVLISAEMPNRFPPTVCGNVYKPLAYSWTRDKMKEDEKYISKSGPKLPIDVQLGESSPDLLDEDKPSYRSCVQSSAESLHFRDEYYAAYYWRKGLENTKDIKDDPKHWINICMSRTANISGNLIKGFTDAQGNFIEFDHDFRRTCDDDGGELAAAGAKRPASNKTKTLKILFCCEKFKLFNAFNNVVYGPMTVVFFVD